MKINGFKSLFGQETKQLDPKRRYLNLDGSSFGLRGIPRLLTIPMIKYGTLGVVVVAGGIAFAAPQKDRQSKLIDRVILGGVDVVLAYSINRRFKTRLPISGEAVIDKSGYNNGNIAASIKMTSFYRHEALFSLLTSAGVYVTDVAVGQPDNPYVIPLVANAAWSWYASKNLSGGKWTIRTAPPEIKKEEKTAVRSMLQAGIVQTRLIP